MLSRFKPKFKRKKVKPFKKYNFKKKSSQKLIRKANLKKRKNFFPTLLLTLGFWLATAFIINFIDPDEKGALQFFFFAIFFTLLFSFATLFANARRGFITTIAIVSFLTLRYLEVGNIINLLLISGLAISIELYFSKS